MRKFQRSAFAAAVVALFLIVASTPVFSARIKASLAGSGLAGCPNNDGSVIRVMTTDATRATGTISATRIGGDQGFSEGSSLLADSMYLDCNGTTVAMYHSSQDFDTQGDPPSQTVRFSPVTVNAFDYDAIETISPPIDQVAVWCTLYLPEESGCVWPYPDAILLDRVKPNIAGSALITNTMIAQADGQAYWSWQFGDPNTAPDPDGTNGLGCPQGPDYYLCNKTDTRFEWQIFRRAAGELYGTSAVNSTDGSLYYLTDPDVTTTNDRMITTPDEFCYVVRISDTAGNWSVVFDDLNTDPDTTAKEKCLLTDGAAPVFERVDFYTAFDPVTGFSGTFPTDDFGDTIVTSNPCFYATGTCDASANRYIYLKITVSEPLFDGVNHYGANIISGDGFDNDNDGLIDEEAGGFDNVDNDGDGAIDEDVAYTTTTYAEGSTPDRKDNDADGYVDEHHNNETGGDSHNQFCAADQLWNRARSGENFIDSCIDLPRIFIYGPDNEGTTPANGSDVTWVCTQDNVTTNPSCQGLSYGETVYEFAWRVGRPQASDVPPIGLEEGEFSFKFSATDGVGNVATEVSPTYGAAVWMDNTAPIVNVSYYSSDAFSTNLKTLDHDHDGGTVTPIMPMAPEGDIYIKVTADENFGETPSMYVFLPDAGVPAYNGVPQPGVYATPTLYHNCSQDAQCDWCTGTNCTAYAPLTNPCADFRTCFTIDAALNNGYSAVVIKAMDMTRTRKWHETDAQAIADQDDADKKRDDAGEDGDPDTADNYNDDGIPNFISASPVIEPDTDLNSGQFFAIDTFAPATPSVCFPVAPCNGEVARQNMSCLTAASTVNNPTINWTTLDNGTDDDVDGSTDEECVNGIDDDLDGEIDEDATVCGVNDTPFWSISQWRLQVSTTSDFQSGTFIKNSIVDNSYFNMPVLAERSADAPYYWRVSPQDGASNVGPYNPQAPLVATDTPYFSFFVDTIAPSMEISYYVDESCSVPMTTTPDDIPITGDTYRDPDKVVCMEITSSESIPWATVTAAMPALTTYQQGFSVQATTTTPVPTDSVTIFRAILEIDARDDYSDGQVEVKFSTQDLYGNVLTDTIAATGGVFIVDSQAPECIINAAEPDPASSDNDQDGESGELVDDAVRISFYCNKFIGATVPVRIKQNNFPVVPTSDDGIDNDCDGLIDEGDAGDPGTSQKPGSGCLISTVFTTGSSEVYNYEGFYNVVPTYFDGTAEIIMGDTATGSAFFLTDLIGSTIYETSSFEVDTTAPPIPILTKPTTNQVLDTALPQFGWKLSTTPPDTYEYKLEIATTAVFTNIAANVTYPDNGAASYFYTLIQSNVDECYINYDNLYDCPGLSDNQYYWRAFSYDTAHNRSESSFVQSFYVDTATPSLPIFNAVTSPTSLPTSPLSGYTSPVEKNAQVNIYVNDTYVGTVTTDDDGKFTIGIDDDEDGYVDEDPVDETDNDSDSLIDEDPPGIFLREGNNIIEGLVIDAGGNVGNRGCNPTTSFYDAGDDECVIVLDSGPPKFLVTYYSDSGLTQALPVIDSETGKQAAKAGVIYLHVTALEAGGLPTPPTFSVNQQGSTDVSTQPTTSIGTSTVYFTGSYEVHAQNVPSYIDGDAGVIVIGTDEQGNTTPADSLPVSGAYFTIDTNAATFSVEYFSDADMLELLHVDIYRYPITNTVGAYLRIQSNEVLASAPLINVAQPGSADVSATATTAMDSTLRLFKYSYAVNAEDGSSYIDGLADVTFDSSDVAGNAASGTTPILGPSFMIDTTPPKPPTLVLTSNGTTLQTGYTQIYSKESSVTDQLNQPEPKAYVEVFVKLDVAMGADDELDNDGDGRYDEEPNGSDGIDNDVDGFIDEDTSANACNSGYIWDTVYSECLNVVISSPEPDGTANADASGTFRVLIKGITLGQQLKNYVYTRATDIAGNTSNMSTGTIVIATGVEGTTFTPTLSAGWNLLGIPMQPAISEPNAALSLFDYRVFQLRDGTYVYNSLDPIKPGACYWVFMETETTLSCTGVTSSTNAVELKEGWNLIGLPFNSYVEWNNEVMVTSFSNTYTLGTTEADALVESVIYEYNGSIEPTGYKPAIGLTDGHVISPGDGFAIKAKEDCTLVFPVQ